MQVVTHRAVKLKEKVLEWPNKHADNVPLSPPPSPSFTASSWNKTAFYIGKQMDPAQSEGKEEEMCKLK